jgi:predicted ATP-grasp superfamily ATP-dependent carboligase
MGSAPRPILVGDAGFAGTLAAVRSLGRCGLPITVADPQPLAPALWSRYVTQRVTPPPYRQFEPFVDWLLAFGARAPRHVICPTSDEFTFALAAHRDAVKERFDVNVPPLAAVLAVLDKQELYAHARASGLDTPDTWLPTTFAEVRRVGAEARFPLLVKPRIQVLLDTHSKGVIVHGPSELPAAYARFAEGNTFGKALLAHRPDAGWPMLQAYHPRATEGIYVLSGFYDQVRSRAVALGATKILQRPRRLGIGLCFEEAPAHPHLVAGVARMCERTGYHGIFQLEFIREDDRFLLIDFNPRFYNFLALDIARGLALPEMVYAAARGDHAEVARLMDAVPNAESAHGNGNGNGNGNGRARGKTFCNRFGLGLLMGAQRLSKRMSAEDADRWRAWWRENKPQMVDAAADPDDPTPARVDVAWQLYLAARHPRSFVRTVMFDA